MAQDWRGSYKRYQGFFLNLAEVYKKRADFRAFLEIMLSISTVTIFLLFALKPTAVTIIGLLKQLKEKEQILTVLTQKVSDLQAAGKVLAQAQTSIPNIDLAVPEVPKPDILAQQVEGLAIKDGVEILGISIGQFAVSGTPAENKKGSIKPLPQDAKGASFSISARGSYQNLAAFTSDFKNLRIVSNIDTAVVGSSLTDRGLVIVLIISGRLPYLGK
jgi:hypothetical protein